MEILSVPVARLIAILEIADLDPRGKISYPELFVALADRYKFHKFPQRTEEFDLQKGAVFEAGKWARGSVEKLTIFGGGFVIDTRSSTDDSEAFLHDMVGWGEKEFGISGSPANSARTGYVNQLVFRSDVPLLARISSPLSALARKVSDAVEERERQKIDYEPTQVWIHYDHQATRKAPLAAFTIQRRVDAPFSENKYFSEAPLRTQQHVEFLASLEEDIRRTISGG